MKRTKIVAKQSAAQRAVKLIEQSFVFPDAVVLGVLADLRREDRWRREMEREIRAWWLSHKPVDWDARFYAEHLTCNIGKAGEKLARIAARIEKERK